MKCKKYFSMTLRVIFRVCMFEVLSKAVQHIRSRIEKHWVWISNLLNLVTAAAVVSAIVTEVVVAATIVARHRWFSHHRHSPPSMVSHHRLPPSMVAHRHSPRQPLSHEISLMQIGTLDSYHVSNLKFKYLKSLCPFHNKIP